jgi:hypothetical protein
MTEKEQGELLDKRIEKLIAFPHSEKIPEIKWRAFIGMAVTSAHTFNLEITDEWMHLFSNSLRHYEDIEEYLGKK